MSVVVGQRPEIDRCSDSDDEGPSILDAQGTLSTRDLALLSGNAPSGLLERNGKGLESALRAVVVIEAAEAVDVDGDAGCLSERIHAVRDHFAAEFSNLFALQAQVHYAEGSVRQIHDRTAQSLIERYVGGPKAGKAGGGAQSLREGIAQGEAAVLSSVVIVNCSTRRTAVSQRDLRCQARNTEEPRIQGLRLKVGGAKTRQKAMRDDVL